MVERHPSKVIAAGSSPVSRSHKKKPTKRQETERGYSLWNPPPGWQQELAEVFKDIKIDPNVVIDEKRIERALKDLEKQLEPFKPRPLSPDIWFRQICDH